MLHYKTTGSCNEMLNLESHNVMESLVPQLSRSEFDSKGTQEQSQGRWYIIIILFSILPVSPP